MNERALLGMGIGLAIAGCVAGCEPSKTTSPDTRNELASLLEAPQFSFHDWKVIASAADRGEGTMSMLLGNDLAVKTSRAGHRPYPPGAVLSLVSWKPQEDAHWFGADIPGAVRSVEQVTFSTTDTEHPSYDKYEGRTLTKIPVEPASAGERIAYIVGQRASVMP